MKFSNFFYGVVSLSGIHSLLPPSDNLNKVEPLPSLQFCCLYYHQYYGLLRLPLCKSAISLHQIICDFFTAYTVQSRVSPVPDHTFNTYRFLYTGGFFDGAIQVLPIFHGLRPVLQGSTSPFNSVYQRPFLTMRQNSLNVTVCIFARPAV